MRESPKIDRLSTFGSVARSTTVDFVCCCCRTRTLPPCRLAAATAWREADTAETSASGGSPHTRKCSKRCSGAG
eukprot:3385468-Pyramimonas_sp.AAC.1